jgi:hypothetical protein
MANIANRVSSLSGNRGHVSGVNYFFSGADTSLMWRSQSNFLTGIGSETREYAYQDATYSFLFPTLLS